MEHPESAPGRTLRPRKRGLEPEADEGNNGFGIWSENSPTARAAFESNPNFHRSWVGRRLMTYCPRNPDLRPKSVTMRVKQETPGTSV